MKKKKTTQKRAKDDLVIKPTSDLFIARLWSAPKNEPLLRDFINAVLLDIGMAPIVKATVVNRFNIKKYSVSKTMILDVLVVDENRRRFNIEVQVASHEAFEKRILLYWAELYSSQLWTGDNYSELRPVVSIVITEFGIFPKLKDPHNLFQITAKEDPTCVLTEDLQIHVLRLSDFLKGHWEELKKLHRKLQDWVNFFVFGATKTEEEMSQLVENNPIIREAYKELKRFSANPIMRDKERQRQRFLADYNLMMNTAKREAREEGMAEGKEEGKAEGRAEGRAEGKAEGKAEGTAESKKEIVRNMKQKGYPAKDIAEITGLSLAEIKRVK